MSKTYAAIAAEIATDLATNHAQAISATKLQPIVQDVLDYAKDAIPPSHTHTVSDITDFVESVNEAINPLKYTNGWISIIDDITIDDSTHFRLTSTATWDSIIGINTPVRIYDGDTYTYNYVLITNIITDGLEKVYTLSGVIDITPTGLWIGDNSKVITEKFSIPGGAFAANSDYYVLINQLRDLNIWQNSTAYPVRLTAFCIKKDSSSYNSLINFKRIRMTEPTFSGSGENDISIVGVYSGNSLRGDSRDIYQVEITSGEKFKWRKSSDSWSTELSIHETQLHYLIDGISIHFNGGSHIAGDAYSFAPTEQLFFADNTNKGIEIYDVYTVNDPALFEDNFDIKANDRLEIVIDKNGSNGDAEDAIFQLVLIKK
jgi:hypothetical protein